MNNSTDSMSFIALNKLKHEAYNRSVSQVDLKLTDFTRLDAHTPPTHGTAWRGRVVFLQCVCATSSLGIRIELSLKSYSLCIYRIKIKISNKNWKIGKQPITKDACRYDKYKFCQNIISS